MTHPGLSQEITDAALAASSADGCVVVTAEHSETNLRWAANSLTTNGLMTSRSVTVIATFDRRGGTSVGVVTRSVSTPDEVQELVRAAEAAGRNADPAEDAAELVPPAGVGPGGGAGAADWDAAAPATDVAVFDAVVPGFAGGFREWNGAGLLLYGFAEHRMTSYFLASSTGLRRRFDQPDGRLEINGKSADLARSTWSGLHTEDFADVDVAHVLDGMRTRLEWARRRIDLPPGRYETLLPPTSVADLFVYAYWTASARDAMEGRNVFASNVEGSTRTGEKLSPLPISLRSDPAYPGLGCAPFEIATSSSAGVQSVFDNGAEMTPASWLTDGTLTELISTRAWAAQSGGTPRFAVDNLIMTSAGSDASLDDLVASTERGLLLTSMWYIREVDPQNLLLTGLTRDGVYLVEDGRVRGAVNNFRFNESPVDLLGRVSEVGRTEHTLSREWSDEFTRTAMPALRVPDFNMSTVSPAT